MKESEESLSCDETYNLIWKITFNERLYETETRKRVGLIIVKLNPTFSFTKKTKAQCVNKKDMEAQTDLFDLRLELTMNSPTKVTNNVLLSDDYNLRPYEQSSPSNQNLPETKSKKVKRINADDKNTIDSWYLNKKEVNTEMINRYPF